MKSLTKILLLVSCIVVLNGCTEADIRALNNALYGNTTPSYQQRPVYVQPSFPNQQRCTSTYNSILGGYITNCRSY